MLAGAGAAAPVAPAWAQARQPAAVSADEPSGQQVSQSSDELSRIRDTAATQARERVRAIAMSYLPAEIRVSAWNALRSSRGDEAIAEWFAPGGGYDFAKQWASSTRARNKAFCERVVRTHTREFSPEVRRAAERALRGSAADQAAFVKTGYAQAKEKDRAAREADAAHRQQIADRDRDFVRSLAEHDPGEQVRVAAQWALRDGAGGEDVAEFFGYGWMSGAALDLAGYRMRVADAGVGQHRVLSRLIEKAEAAEAAVQGSADAAKARAEAGRAWKAVADHAGAAHQAWLAEQAAAAAQAENWKKIAQAARETTDGLWKNIAGPAEKNQDAWAREHQQAGREAAFWKGMSDRAQDAESRVTS
ncbi:Syd protein [Streptomyces sp. NBRC 110611]|nr:Syd protein [Streptomyces sp. NBRC 110611]